MKNFLVLFLISVFVSANAFATISSQETKPHTAEAESRPPLKIAGVFDDVLEGFKKTIEDAKKLGEMTEESGRVNVMIKGLDGYLDAHNRAVLNDEVRDVLWRKGNYGVIELKEIEDWAKFRKQKFTKSNPQERARILPLSNLGVLVIHIVESRHSGHSRGTGILKMTTKAKIKFTLYQASLGKVIWRKKVHKTVYGEITTKKENYNKNMHGVTLKDTNMRTLVLTALTELLPELPKKHR